MRAHDAVLVLVALVLIAAGLLTGDRLSLFAACLPILLIALPPREFWTLAGAHALGGSIITRLSIWLLIGLFLGTLPSSLLPLAVAALSLGLVLSSLRLFDGSAVIASLGNGLFSASLALLAVSVMFAARMLPFVTMLLPAALTLSVVFCTLSLIGGCYVPLSRFFRPAFSAVVEGDIDVPVSEFVTLRFKRGTLLLVGRLGISACIVALGQISIALSSLKYEKTADRVVIVYARTDIEERLRTLSIFLRPATVVDLTQFGVYDRSALSALLDELLGSARYVVLPFFEELNSRLVSWTICGPLVSVRTPLARVLRFPPATVTRELATVRVIFGHSEIRITRDGRTLISSRSGYAELSLNCLTLHLPRLYFRLERRERTRVWLRIGDLKLRLAGNTVEVSSPRVAVFVNPPLVRVDGRTFESWTAAREITDAIYNLVESLESELLERGIKLILA